MKNEGATLIELLIAVATVAVLLLVTGFSYQGWMGGYEIEKATKEIYTDFMHARFKAVQTNMQHIAVTDKFSYTIAEDRNQNKTLDSGDAILPGFPKSLRYELCDNRAGKPIIFDKKGLLFNARTLNFAETEFGPDYDCVTISMSRVIMGRYKFNHDPNKDDICIIK